jgi:hypothetical protein
MAQFWWQLVHNGLRMARSIGRWLAREGRPETVSRGQKFTAICPGVP